jgi:hypothetical protein
MDKDEKIKEMEEQISNLETELQATKEHLKKYTAPASNKVYYEKHKDIHKHRVSEYKKKTNYKPTPEQVKLYTQRAYLKRKETLQKEMEEKQNTENI